MSDLNRQDLPSDIDIQRVYATLGIDSPSQRASFAFGAQERPVAPLEVTISNTSTPFAH